MNTQTFSLNTIKAIIGLGNTGSKFYYNRHNIGFRIVEELAKKHNGIFTTNGCMEMSQITLNNKPVLLIMPQTFMNSSGKVIPFLTKKGIAADNILVIHDELELPFTKIKFKTGGSAKGHNGLKSIIQSIGPDFHRLAIGISRPDNREDVPDYVLQNFKDPIATQSVIDQAVSDIEKFLI